MSEKKFDVTASGLAYTYTTKAKNKKQAYKNINKILKGELKKIEEAGGGVEIYSTPAQKRKIKRVS